MDSHTPEFPAPDPEIEWDLESLAGAQRLITWTADQFGRVADLDVIEVGAGIGTYTSVLLEKGARSVLAVEPDPLGFERLKSRFVADPRVSLSPASILGSDGAAIEGEADLVVCQNVLEHIQADHEAFNELVTLVKPGGTLFLLVPANPWLFGSLDEKFEHFRRYRKADLEELARGADLEIVSLRAFNALGILGWLLKGKTGRTEIGNRSLRVYEFLLRIWRPFEDRCDLPIGLSFILTARRNS